MSRVYGYCRISRREQSIERQIRNIKAAYPDAMIVQEVYTGRKVAGRKKFEQLLKTAQSGDTIVFDSVSRMSRNAEEGWSVYKQLFDAGVELVFLKEPHINTRTYRDALERQISTASNSGDAYTDELISGIAEALNKYMMRLAEKQIIYAFEQSEKEVADLRIRTSEGIQTARLNGKQIGILKGSKLHTKKSDAVKENIRKHSKDFGGTLNDIEVIKLIGCARNTYYKYKRELSEEA